jgi:hypothetical protein
MCLGKTIDYGDRDMDKPNQMGRANIINFIRFDHGMTTVEGEMQEIVKRGLPATWLLQYDALAMGPYVAYLKANMQPNHEVGLWFEVNRKHCQDACVQFRGEIPAPGNTQDTENWDHHSQAMMSCGYSQKDRIKLIDTMMEKFKAIWGKYPVSVCAWYIDSFSLKYLADKYHILATANCKEQWGTDGYSLWGGPCHGFYYPSETNAMAAACSREHQIDVPVFRMLGLDPVNFHDAKIETNGQPVYTLEPAYADGGGSPTWVKRFFDMFLQPTTRPFAYFQVGQENSFPWENMKAGFCFQLDELIRREKAGRLVVETLGETGRFVKETYKETPVGILDGSDNLNGEDFKAIWYHSPNYRAMIVYGPKRFEIVDLYRYLPTDTEANYEKLLNNWTGTFMPLPMIDSFLFGSRWFLAGTAADGKTFDERNFGIRDVTISIESDDLSVRYANDAGAQSTIRFQPSGITVERKSSSSISIQETIVYDRAGKWSPIQGIYRNHVVFGWNNTDYRLTVKECIPCIDRNEAKIILGAYEGTKSTTLSLMMVPCRAEVK